MEGTFWVSGVALGRPLAWQGYGCMASIEHEVDTVYDLMIPYRWNLGSQQTPRNAKATATATVHPCSTRFKFAISVHNQNK
jgi:hypothetical protein